MTSGGTNRQRWSCRSPTRRRNNPRKRRNRSNRASNASRERKRNEGETIEEEERRTRREGGDTIEREMVVRASRTRAVRSRRDSVCSSRSLCYEDSIVTDVSARSNIVSRARRVARGVRAGTESDGFRRWNAPPLGTYLRVVHLELFVCAVHFLTSLRSLNWSTPLVKMAPWAEKSSASPVSPAAPGVVRYSKYVSGRFPVRL